MNQLSKLMVELTRGYTYESPMLEVTPSRVPNNSQPFQSSQTCPTQSNVPEQPLFKPNLHNAKKSWTNVEC
ncbi:hypothetical protein OUZ56_015722 [Daphnia magna]|uniref:Uncharacterized protein n=1 Tax=Daphnia magna TaxID=35525 RepID=A0ABR0ANS3_9CRUS|nr:hypothetical protein OUZ56_015722 [Daphnia magna]